MVGEKELPSGWKTIQLGALGRIVTGKTPLTKIAEYFGGRVPFITPSDMDGRRLIGETQRYLTEKGASSVSGARIPQGAVMVSCIGSDMGKAAIASRYAVTNQQINAIIVGEDFLNLYVYYNLSMRKAELQHLASGGSAQPILNKGHFSQLHISMPPLKEQQAIARILGTLDDKIELNRRMNETIEAIARAIFKSWFVDFDPVRAKADGRQLVGMDAETAALFPDSFEDSPLGKIPRGWTIIDLGEVMSIYDSKRVPLSNREREKRRGPYPYYGAASVMDYIDDYLFDGRYVLVGEDGSVIDYDDHPVLQYVWGKFWANNHAHVLQGTNGISTEFLLQFLKTLNIGPYITGAVQPKLNQGNLKSIPFIKPPKTVCSMFDQTIGSLFSRIRSATDETRTLATTRDTLLPRLVSGEIRVKDVEKFVEKHAG